LIRSRFVEKLEELDEALVEEAITLAKIIRTVGDSEAGQITAKKHDVDTLKSLVGIGKGYIEL